MNDEPEETAIGMAGALLFLVSTPVLAVGAWRHGAWWSTIAVVAFAIAVVFFVASLVADIHGSNGDSSVPDDPTDVLEDGDSE